MLSRVKNSKGHVIEVCKFADVGGVTLSDIAPTPTFIEHQTVLRNVRTPCLSARHLDTMDYVFCLKIVILIILLI